MSSHDRDAPAGEETPHRYFPNTTMTMITDITLGHIPDLSLSLSEMSTASHDVLDAESFQISVPANTHTTSADAPSPNWLLLADDSSGFASLRRAGAQDGGREVDDSFATLEDVSACLPTAWSQTRIPHSQCDTTTREAFASPPRAEQMLDHSTPENPSSGDGDDTREHAPPPDHANLTPPLGHDTPKAKRTTTPPPSTAHPSTTLPPSSRHTHSSEDRLARLSAELNLLDARKEDAVLIPACADPSSGVLPLSTEDAVVGGVVYATVQNADEEVESEAEIEVEAEAEPRLPHPSPKHDEHPLSNPNSNLDLKPRTSSKSKPGLKPKTAAAHRTVVKGGGISKIPAPKKIAHVARPLKSNTQQHSKPQPSSASNTHDQQSIPSSHYPRDQLPTTTIGPTSVPTKVHAVNPQDDINHTNTTADTEDAHTPSSRGARAGGVTERLVSYSQHLFSSIRRYKSTASVSENPVVAGREGQDAGGGKTEDGCTDGEAHVPCDGPVVPFPPSSSPSIPPGPVSPPHSHSHSRSRSSLTPTRDADMLSGGGDRPLRLSELSPRKPVSGDEDEGADERGMAWGAWDVGVGLEDDGMCLGDEVDEGQVGVSSLARGWIDTRLDANADADADTEEDGTSEPLRLSELSPRKAQHCDEEDEVTRTMMSPMRLGKKRRSSVLVSMAMLGSVGGDGDEEGCLMGGGYEREGEHEREGGEEMRPSKRGKTSSRSVNQESGSGSTSTSTLPTKRKKYTPLGAGGSSSSGAALAGSRSRRAQEGKKDGRVRVRIASGGAGKNRTRRERRGDVLPLVEKSQNAFTGPHVQITKPVAFTFRVDARLEARKGGVGAGGEERGGGKVTGVEQHAQGQGRLHRSTPHFPPSHSARTIETLHRSHPVHETRPGLASTWLAPSSSSSSSSHHPHAHPHVHKENHSHPHPHAHAPLPIHPFTFATTQRVSDRARFDAHVRQKAEEAERAREAEQRAREEEEEREVREMRRRMVPRAREVPGWYYSEKRGG